MWSRHSWLKLQVLDIFKNVVQDTFPFLEINHISWSRIVKSFVSNPVNCKTFNNNDYSGNTVLVNIFFFSEISYLSEMVYTNCEAYGHKHLNMQPKP